LGNQSHLISAWHIKTLIKTIYLQVVLIVTGSLFGCFFNQAVSASVLVGGLCYFLPNLWFAFWLRQSSRVTGSSAGVPKFVIGELVKVAAVIALLYFAQSHPEFHWGAMIVGLIISTQANFFAFLLKI
jgi:F0F1-type ATP synthase assembly protein I